MVIDKQAAIEEIKALSKNTKDFIRTLSRDHLQSITSALDLRDAGAIRDAVMEHRHKLEKMGL